MTVRYIFFAYVFLTIATALGLNSANAAVIYQVSPVGDLNTRALTAGLSPTPLPNRHGFLNLYPNTKQGYIQ
jgi:hypothetical protein